MNKSKDIILPQINPTEARKMKNILREKPAVVAISGPSGAGKDFLTSQAVDCFLTIGIPCNNVQMVTDRPSRKPGVETKVCITSLEYSELQRRGKLIGDHLNVSHYGYRTADIQAAMNSARSSGGLVILELNPITQTDFPDMMTERLGTGLAAWVGVKTTPEQTRLNMLERGESPENIENRLAIMSQFNRAMKGNNVIQIVDNGPTNRKRSTFDFIHIIIEAIKKLDKTQ